MYDVSDALKNSSAALKSSCDSCQGPQCDPPDSARVVHSAGLVTSFPGHSHLDHSHTDSSAMFTLYGQMMYVLGSFNTITSVDLSLHVPCGRLMEAFQPVFTQWGLQPGQQRHQTYELSLNQGQGQVPWTCTVAKQVQAFESVVMTKNTGCCAPKVTRGRKACCVKKFTSGKLPSDTRALKLAIGAM